MNNTVPNFSDRALARDMISDPELYTAADLAWAKQVVRDFQSNADLGQNAQHFEALSFPGKRGWVADFAFWAVWAALMLAILFCLTWLAMLGVML